MSSTWIPLYPGRERRSIADVTNLVEFFTPPDLNPHVMDELKHFEAAVTPRGRVAWFPTSSEDGPFLFIGVGSNLDLQALSGLLRGVQKRMGPFHLQRRNPQQAYVYDLGDTARKFQLEDQLDGVLRHFGISGTISSADPELGG